MFPHRRYAITAALRIVTIVTMLVLSFSAATRAEASTPTTTTGFARMAAPLISHLETQQRAQRAQEEGRRDPPPVADPASGPVVSVFGGSVFSGSSAFQSGGAFAYFFGSKATVGVEAEGSMTFGPGGRVTQFMGSFVLQAGARTSKFVPYIALGAGVVRATTEFRQETADALAELGINPEPTSESAPFLQFGGGLRFFVRPNLAVRGDVRFAQVALDIDGAGFRDRLFPMNRVAGMISWDF